MSKADYGNFPEDKFLKWKGAKPVERNVHLTEDELRATLEDNWRNHTCRWKQAGSEIYCEVGESRHGRIIGTKLILTGTDHKGGPILAKHPALRN